jgi:heme-degrading monooxygenase HmoA
MTSGHFASTPAPPYFAVIFSSQRTEGENGYDEMAEHMVQLASQQPGFLGIESVRGPNGFGITVSYWTDLDSIRKWKQHAEHQVAQASGRATWYSEYQLRICRVEREYGFPNTP